MCCKCSLTSDGMGQVNHNCAQMRPFFHCWSEDLSLMNNVYNHAVDSISSVANTQTEPAVDVASVRTWPLSLRYISMWLISLYKVLWHRRALIVSRIRLPFGIAWVIIEKEHHLDTLRSPSWTIVDRPSFNIVVCIFVAGEYSVQGHVTLSWHPIVPLV